jgi:subtilase family serine protease
MFTHATSRAVRAARWGLPAAVAAALLVIVLSASASARAGATVVVVGDTPATVHATAVGPVAPTTRLALTVVLKPRNASGLAALAAAVSDPASPSYRHFLSVGEFAARFGASSANVRMLRETLRREGLEPGALARNDLSIAVSGTAGAASRAFHVTLRRYRERSGREVFANTAAPRVPAALRGVVADVLGLDDTQAAAPAGLSQIARSSGAKASARGTAAGAADARTSTGSRTVADATAHSAASAFTGDAGPVPCQAAAGFAASRVGSVNTINQVGDAYRYDGLYADGDFGQGVRVALLELEPYASESGDLSAFESCYGINGASVSDINVDGGSPPAPSPLYFSTAETAVDLENLLGLAPDVAVDVYYGPNDAQGQYDTLGDIVDAPPNQHAQVINNSWGLCEQNSSQATFDAENSLLQEAASQGQTFFSSSGDRGAEGCAPEWNNNLTTQSVPAGAAPAADLGVDDPASQPYATGVGGTDLNALGPPPSETAWEQLYWGASGGGISTIWQMPYWQMYSGVPGVLNSFSSSSPCGAASGQYCREVPDVSADGSTQTGYVTYYQGAWAGFGGTSTSAPDWAALAALADSAVMGDSSDVPDCSTGTAGSPLGFLDPLLYEIDAGGAHADAFNDVTSGENSGYFDGDGVPYGAYPVTSGYDMVTGLGTPIASDGSSPGLVAQLCEAADTSPGLAAIVSGLSAPEASAGAAITVDGSGFTPFAAVWFGSVAASQVTYDSPTQITVTVPPGSGSVPVTVIKLSGVSEANVDAVFTYAPTETINSPASGGTYTQGQALVASYSCAASTAGAPSCGGPVPTGAAIGTSSIGTQHFTVTATDANGVTTTTTATYTVVAPPAIAVSGISAGGTYAQGQALSARVTCTTSPPITISACTAPTTINTSAPGTYSFNVVAIDSNGVSTTDVITYNVVAAPKATISSPAAGAYYLLRQSLSSSFACAAVAPAHVVSCAGPVASGASVDTSTLGVHRFQVTVTDSSGVSATASASYTVVALRARITALRQAASRWIEAAARGSSPNAPVGTRFTFSLDQPAHVTLRFARSVLGRVKGQQCVSPALASSHAHKCTRSVRAGSLTVAGEPGSNTVEFGGRTSSGRLAAGTYTVVLQATGLSGRPSVAAALLFTIAPAKRH